MQNVSFIHLNRRSIRLLFICFTLLFVLAACGPADEEENNPPINTNGYPVGESGYPTIALSDNSAYPVESEIDESERFTIDQPLMAGDTTITGQAPKNISLAIVNITLSGTILGTGTSGDDGRFTINVDPLPESYRIGVTVTDVEAGKTMEEVSIELYDFRGEGFMNIPSVGIFFDSAMVQP